MSSLKWVHFFVIVVSILMSFGLSLWCLMGPGKELGFTYELMGAFSLVLGLFLSFYLWKFYRGKMQVLA